MQEGDRRGESEVRLDECGRGERGREKKSATLEKARATFHVLIFELLGPVPPATHLAHLGRKTQVDYIKHVEKLRYSTPSGHLTLGIGFVDTELVSTGCK